MPLRGFIISGIRPLTFDISLTSNRRSRFCASTILRNTPARFVGAGVAEGATSHKGAQPTEGVPDRGNSVGESKFSNLFGRKEIAQLA